MKGLRIKPRYRKPTRRKTLVNSLARSIRKDRGSKTPAVRVDNKLFDIKFSSLN